MRRAIMNRHLEQNREDMVQSKYLADDADAELWRITVRQPSLTERRYSELLNELRDGVEGVLASERRNGADGVSVVYTGLLPLVARSQWELIKSLLISFWGSMILIAVTLMLGLRDIRLGLLSTLPNFFPIFVVFGGFGWLGQSIDVGSMMTASIGLGIAVDDTVHYLTWFKRGLEQGLTRERAVLFAYRHCGTAMLRTTVICGSGLMLFALSSFGPAARFGGMIVLLLLAALIGDLVFLPALLVGRLGRKLFPNRAKRAEV
jgi:predicted RND superfamily exporter protein